MKGLVTYQHRHSKGPYIACGSHYTLSLQILRCHPARGTPHVLFGSQAPGCSSKMGEAEVCKERTPIIGDQNITLLFMTVVESNIWSRDKYTHAFNVPMYNGTPIMRMQVRQSVGNSHNLKYELR